MHTCLPTFLAVGRYATYRRVSRAVVIAPAGKSLLSYSATCLGDSSQGVRLLIPSGLQRCSFDVTGVVPRSGLTTGSHCTRKSRFGLRAEVAS